MNSARWLGSILVLVTSTTPAFGFAPRGGSSAENGRIEVADGAAGEGGPRLVRHVGDRVPFRAARAWSRFLERTPGAWRATWDSATGAPDRIFGGYVSVPGSVASSEAARRAAKDLLAAHLDLFAPGARPGDFVLVSDDLDAGMRTVAFEQHSNGLEVLGGAVSFRFKNDRLFLIASTAIPHVTIEAPEVQIDQARARAIAESWIRETGAKARVRAVHPAAILPLIGESAPITHRAVIEVEVDATSPIGRWSVYVDARTGERVARRQTLKFASGTVAVNVPERRPGSTRLERPASETRVLHQGSQLLTDAQGVVTWTASAAADLTIGVVGPKVRINNEAGPEITESFTLDPGATFVWNKSNDELADAQLVTYISSLVVKAKAKQIAPGMTWLDANQLGATVNYAESCNAFSDGDTIHFFRAGGGCENTGRLPDVIYHEFGHAFHAHAIIPGAGSFDGDLSEGAGDYLTATLTGDPGMGRGFFRTNAALRHVDPPDDEAVWPEDVDSDPHITGLIFAGAMWDLRKALIASLGEGPGVERADFLFYQILRRASDIPSSYPEALAADDDDGDIGNGTPNQCQIDSAFGLHGLAESGPRRYGVGAPIAHGLHVELPVAAANTACAGSGIRGVTLSWKLRSTPAVAGTVQMTAGGAGWTGDIPPLSSSNEVVLYQLEVQLDGGEKIALPDNEADPWYEVFVGMTVPLYCTDFESDPSGDGWRHQLLRGRAAEGADDWMWGVLEPTPGSEDPTSAYSGQYVYGNDLGGGNFNGKYQPDKVNALTSPDVETRGYANVRLQYRRWLTIEDGAFDKARILANGTERWKNFATSAQDGTTHHRDREWRFHDVDLSSSVRDGRVQVQFELESDGGLEMGGWTIDDFCVVAVPDSQGPRCGDAMLSAGEQCDDGNTTSGDGCESDCRLPSMPVVCGDGVVGGAEQCDDGNTAAGDTCNADCTLPAAGAVCGNGVVEAGEECDAGAASAECTATCTKVAGPTPGTPGTGGNGPGEINEAEPGCGCAATPVEDRSSGALAVVLLLGLAAILRRRARR